MRAQGYTITTEQANDHVAGYRLMGKEGAAEIRSELTFEIETTGPTETRFAVQARTLRGVPPAMDEVDADSSAASTDMQTLLSRLTCPNARWSRCP